MKCRICPIQNIETTEFNIRLNNHRKCVNRQNTLTNRQNIIDKSAC